VVPLLKTHPLLLQAVDHPLLLLAMDHPLPQVAVPLHPPLAMDPLHPLPQEVVPLLALRVHQEANLPNNKASLQAPNPRRVEFSEASFQVQANPSYTTAASSPTTTRN